MEDNRNYLNILTENMRKYLSTILKRIFGRKKRQWILEQTSQRSSSRCILFTKNSADELLRKTMDTTTNFIKMNIRTYIIYLT